MRRLMALAIVVATAVPALDGQTPPPRTFLIVVDDLHLDFRHTPRLRKILQDVSQQGREADRWALVTTGLSRTRVEPAAGLAGIRAAVSRVAGNALKAREELDAFGDPERTAIVRRRALLIDIAVADAISDIAEQSEGPLTILFISNGYDGRMVPPLSETVRTAVSLRAQFLAISVRGVDVPEPPADVSPDEWTAYVEASGQSLRALADQTGGQAAFSQSQLDAALLRLLRPRDPSVPPKTFLMFVDDLHLDFRQTPRTRRSMQDLLARLARDGDVWSVVTTGTSSLWVHPTTDLTAIRAAVSRVTGNSLKMREQLDRAAPEPRLRAEVSYKTAADAIARVAAVPDHGPITVLYISSGYDTRVVPPPAPVIEAAARVNARIIAMWPLTPSPAAGDVPPDQWAAYVTATQGALRTLATETSGLAVFTPDDLEQALRLVEPNP